MSSSRFIPQEIRQKAQHNFWNKYLHSKPSKQNKKAAIIEEELLDDDLAEDESQPVTARFEEAQTDEEFGSAEYQRWLASRSKEKFEKSEKHERTERRRRTSATEKSSARTWKVIVEQELPPSPLEPPQHAVHVEAPIAAHVEARVEPRVEAHAAHVAAKPSAANFQAVQQELPPPPLATSSHIPKPSFEYIVDYPKSMPFARSHDVKNSEKDAHTGNLAQTIARNTQASNLNANAIPKQTSETQKDTIAWPLSFLYNHKEAMKK